MITILDGYPADVLACSATGQVTAHDYRNVLVPGAEARLKHHDKIRMLFILGDHFEGYAPGAMLADAEFGVGHLHSLGRTALITDKDWIAEAMRLFAPFIPVPIRIFATSDFEQANEWLLEGDRAM